jgi:hypothetical protein
LDTLKALILDFLKENPSGPLKDTSEGLLNKITGIQLLSQEIGPTQQYVVNMPFSLWNQTVDLTIQWSGRKQENGQIDPAYCRVLFYLDLQNLKETIVDVQVQNRILNMTIFNDMANLKELSSPFIDKLKENLLVNGYTLSKIHFMNTQEHQQKNISNQVTKLIDTRAYSGVDIRV